MVFETRVEILEPKKEKKKSFAAAKKTLQKTMKRKREDTDSSVVQSSEESTETRHPKKTALYTINVVILKIVAKVYVLWSTSTSGKRKNFRNYRKSNKECCNRVEISEICQEQEKEKNKKKFPHF